MFNHKFHVSETDWDYDYTNRYFEVTADEDMSEIGTEIFLTYGSKCNTRLFVNYGFAVAHNDDNTVVVELRIPAADPAFWIKTRFLDTDDSGKTDSVSLVQFVFATVSPFFFALI